MIDFASFSDEMQKIAASANSKEKRKSVLFRGERIAIPAGARVC